MKKPHFATGHFYHIYNRGLDKRKIFLNDSYYFRYLRGLDEFNDPERVANFNWKLKSTREPVTPPAGDKTRLVDIICFCLMPNHFHLILRQKEETGIVKFMQKLGTGYALFFNQKQKRKGSLFESRFKATLIEDDVYLLHLSRYIHLNPLKLLQPAWEEEGVKDREEASRFLNGYKWSSYADYRGKPRFKSLVDKEVILSCFQGADDYRDFMINYIEVQPR